MAVGCRTLLFLKGCGFKFNPIETKTTTTRVLALNTYAPLLRKNATTSGCFLSSAIEMAVFPSFAFA